MGATIKTGKQALGENKEDEEKKVMRKGQQHPPKMKERRMKKKQLMKAKMRRLRAKKKMREHNMRKWKRKKTSTEESMTWRNMGRKKTMYLMAILSYLSAHNSMGLNMKMNVTMTSSNVAVKFLVSLTLIERFRVGPIGCCLLAILA